MINLVKTEASIWNTSCAYSSLLSSSSLFLTLDPFLTLERMKDMPYQEDFWNGAANIDLTRYIFDEYLMLMDGPP